MDLLLITLLPLTGLLLGGVRYVPEDTVVTVRRFGRSLRVLTPGLRYTVPMLDRVTQRIRLIGHQVGVTLSGNALAHAEIYYQILEPKRTGSALEQIDALVQQHASLALSTLSTDSVDDVRQMAAQLKQALNQDLMTLGLRVTRCDLRPDVTH